MRYLRAARHQRVVERGDVPPDVIRHCGHQALGCAAAGTVWPWSPAMAA
jgi:hypothetical protein